MGLENVVVQKNGQGRGKDFLERRLEKEINELYDRLALSLKNENERLKETLRQLNEENELLRRAARARRKTSTRNGINSFIMHILGIERKLIRRKNKWKNLLLVLPSA